MKAISRSIPVILILFAVVGFYSCEKNPVSSAKGTAEFSISLPDEERLSKSDAPGDTAAIISYHLMVSIEDMEGNPIVTDSLIPLYSFGTAFMSERLELETGQYKLTKFLVINPAGEVVFAAPVEGSPLAYLVKDPLPIIFRINTEQTTKVLPEVLFVGEHTPDEFGYVSFGMQIIKPLHFWTICVIDPGNPEIMAPIQITTAKLTVFAPDGWHYTFRLQAAVNHLIIRGGYRVYTFLLEKEGYAPQKMEFTASQLMATSKENPLILKIPWGNNEWKVLVLQPGPEDGKDAMISNLNPDKNFGDHKYFEATFLSEPMLTVMRSNRSLIWVNLNALPKSAVIKKAVLHLTYDIPVPWDSTIFITNSNGSTQWCGAVLQRIVEPWEEYKVTWNTQPKTTEVGQVYISPFIKNANFIDVNVTSLYVPSITTATDTVFATDARMYGMFFKLWPTERFPGFRFGSSDYPEASMRPKLTIYYTIN
jgi:hypothetical protein